MNKQYMVVYEVNYTNSRPDFTANGWQWRVHYFESEIGAKLFYESLLPGEFGSFGPIQYRNITMCKVLKYTEQ